YRLHGGLVNQVSSRRIALARSIQGARVLERRFMASIIPDNAGDGEDGDAKEGRRDDDSSKGKDGPLGMGESVDPNFGMAQLQKGDSLPLSFRSDEGSRDSEFYLFDEESSNPYFDVVSRLSPTELIGRFMRSSPPMVQNAVRTTVLGLLGSLPRHAFETTAIATGDALANLMFQLQMTGYMFKNAEYRLSIQSSVEQALPGGSYLPVCQGEITRESAIGSGVGDFGVDGSKKPKISGKIRLTFDAGQETEREMEVDADAYMSELRGQVEQLETQLLAIHQKEQEAVENDLLLYIKSMPEVQLKGLTTNVSPEVLESMRLLVQTVLGGSGNGEKILGETLTQQTGSAMGQLCMWQLVVGYSLREMEAREDLLKTFQKSSEE
ncbi:unnamed protein product, partial [Choristocarpus tenellus]